MCLVQYCVYCGSSEHRKVDWLNFKTVTCPELIAKTKHLNEADRKWKVAQAAKQAQETEAYYFQWASKLHKVYYDNMYRQGPMLSWDDRWYDQQGRLYGSLNQQQQGGHGYDQNDHQAQTRTWFSNELVQNDQHEGSGYFDAGQSDYYHNYQQRGSPGCQDDCGPWNGRHANDYRNYDRDQRSGEGTDGDYASGDGGYEPPHTPRHRKRAAAALREADVIDKHDLANKNTASVHAIPQPGKALFSDDPALLPHAEFSHDE